MQSTSQMSASFLGMQDQHLDRGQIRHAGGPHAAHHPAIEGMSGKNEAELHLGQAGQHPCGEMRRRDDGTDGIASHLWNRYAPGLLASHIGSDGRLAGSNFDVHQALPNARMMSTFY
jgi:hypothetical protein